MKKPNLLANTVKVVGIATTVTVGSLALPGNADALTFFSPTISLSSTETPFGGDPAVANPFAKFNSTGVTITAVRVYLDAVLSGNVTFTNPVGSPTRQVRSYTQNGDLAARGPSGVPQLVQVFPTVTVVSSPINLAPGQSRFFSFMSTPASASESILPADWGLFASAGGGTGTVDWLGDAFATSNIQNGINVFTVANISGNFRYEVDFTVNPPPVPEPSTLLGLGSLTLFGLFTIKKKQDS